MTTPTPAAPSGELLRTPASESIGKDPEFLRLLIAHQSAEQAFQDDASDVKRELVDDTWDAFINYLDTRRAAVSQAAPEQAKSAPDILIDTRDIVELQEHLKIAAVYGGPVTLSHMSAWALFNAVKFALAAPSGAPTDTELQRVTHERDMLATAIRDAAVKAGIASADACLTGPHLIMFCENMAECILAPSGAPKQESEPLPIYLTFALSRALQASGWTYSGDDSASDSLHKASIEAGLFKHEHPKLDVPMSAECSAQLDELGDNRGQGLDGYWKWGFRAGWHYATLAAASTVQSAPATDDADPIGDFQAEDRQAKLDDFVASVQSAPVLPEPDAWMKANTGECVSAAEKKKMQNAKFGVWDKAAELYTRPLYFAAAAQSTPVQVEGQQEQTLQPSCDSAVPAEPAGQHDAGELERLRALLNTPELHDFAKGVVLEAAHQQERWSTSHDSGKAPADWFWLIGYLAQKAMTSQMAGNTDKALHHTISTAAAMANWHTAILGKTTMRPGIAPPDQLHSAGSARQGGEHAPEIVQAGALPVAAAPEQKP